NTNDAPATIECRRPGARSCAPIPRGGCSTPPPAPKSSPPRRDDMLRPGIPRLFRLAPWRRKAIESELHEELQFHLERRAAQFRATGMPPDLAWAEAVRRCGSLDSAEHTLKAPARRREAGMRWSHIVDTVGQDTRYVIRQLARAPGFT